MAQSIHQNQPAYRGHEAVDQGATQQANPAGTTTWLQRKWQQFRAEPGHIQAAGALAASGGLIMVVSAILLGLGAVLRSQGMPDLGLAPDSTAMGVVAGAGVTVGGLGVALLGEMAKSDKEDQLEEARESEQLPPDALKG
jgi:hypothetical protein